jgi:DNA invertase Pin-like site-specific DNA recombinase
MKATTVTMRAALYARVSSEEQVEGYSLDAQDRAGRLYCEAHDWDIVQVYRDEGKSARTDDLSKRPDFHRLLADAEAGLLDVIVVHKLDRFSRNLRVTLETLERLEQAGVGFVSISEQMDFTTPIGKVILATLAAFAQYYSDNLATEVKKGKAERKAQGLYNGLLPFGLKPNSGGIPVPDPETYPGLLLAFRLAAEGKSDRDVAEALNAAGYRTTGNRGRNLFSKDTVCRLLQNRFYLGELPDGNGGWLPGAHEPVLDDALFDRAQQARAENRRSVGPRSVPPARRTHSLSGLGVCGQCGGKLHIATDRHGKARIYCYAARQGQRCPQRSIPLGSIEEQLVAYLATFHLPEDTVQEVVRLYERANDQRDDAERRRREIAGRIERIAEMYKWGDLTREAYRSERERLEAELKTLQGATDRAVVMAQAAALLRDLPAAWTSASPEQRNALARLVFAEIEIKEDRVVAVVPQPDFAPFFLLQVGNSDDGDEHADGAESSAPSSEVLNGRKRRGSIASPRHANDSLEPIVVAVVPPRRVAGRSRRAAYHAPRPRKLSIEQQTALLDAAANHSLRWLATEFGVSHETVRRVLRSRRTVSVNN